VITVDPNAKLPGSTSVACWLVELVNVSELNFISGTVAGGKLEPKEFDPLEVELGLEPQPTVPKRTNRIVAEMIPDVGLNGTPLPVQTNL
jgi:hypothetical protein